METIALSLAGPTWSPLPAKTVVGICCGSGSLQSLSQTERSSSAYGRRSLGSLISHATGPSFPMTSASLFDTTVVDEGNMELCMPIVVDSEFVRMLLQQLSKAHMQTIKNRAL